MFVIVSLRTGGLSRGLSYYFSSTGQMTSADVPLSCSGDSLMELPCRWVAAGRPCVCVVLL